ncbi:MAG: hypothetical protein WBK90_07485 [Bacillota bacterium]|nr:hypothetical protein [Bacillota bacterium]HOP70521.1 hypothetical protein [Bacillota bacterium]
MQRSEKRRGKKARAEAVTDSEAGPEEREARGISGEFPERSC